MSNFVVYKNEGMWLHLLWKWRLKELSRSLAYYVQHCATVCRTKC